jgi:hypothetical protein
MLWGSNAYPCSCFISETIEEQFQQYEQVFLGQISVVKPKDLDPIHNEKIDYKIYIALVKAYKGNPDPEIIGESRYFYHDPDEETQMVSSCDPGLREGRLLLVFRNHGDVPGIYQCSSTVRYASDESLRKLEKLSDAVQTTPN